MTGSLQQKKLTSGNTYFYVKLSYKDPRTNTWKSKTIGTGLEVKNNKRKAEMLKDLLLQQYLYLESLPIAYHGAIDPDIMFCDYLDIWLHNKQVDLKKSTYEGYSYRVKRIKDYFVPKQWKLIDITPKYLDTYYKYCLQFGKINQKTHEPEKLAVRSVRSYKSILYAVFTQAVIDGLLKSNPTIGIVVHGKRNRAYSDDMLFLTEDEISNLLHFLSISYPRLVPITFMGAYFGLRRSEILGLKWSSIDFDKKLINIQHTVVRVKSIDSSDNTETPDSKRSLNLFDTAIKCLRQVQLEQQANKDYYRSEYRNKDGFVFTWEDGRYYDPDYITTLFCKSTKEFGRPSITLHKLRHSCASMLINKGWDVKKLQYWLGHTDTQTTLNIYSHFNKQRLNSSDNDLSEISLASADLFT